MIRTFYSILIVCIVAALGAWASPLEAQGSEEDLEAFRAELRAYVADLRELPVALLEAFHEQQPISLDHAERSIELLTPEELVTLKRALEQVPFWRSLPGILATSLPSEEYFSPLELAATLDARLEVGRGPEEFRDQLLSLVDRLGQVRFQVPPKSRTAIELGRVDQLKATITGLDSEELMVLHQALVPKLPEWEQALERSRMERHQRALSDLIDCPLATTSSCSGDFPDGVICELENVVNTVINVPCDVLDLAEAALDVIFDALDDLFSLLEDAIPEASELVDLMGDALGIDLTSSDWIITYFEALAPTAIACPIDLEATPLDDTFSIPVIGTMTTFEGQWACKLTVEFLNGMVADVGPDDVWGLPLKLAAAVLQWPIEYLCLCYEAAAEIEFDDVQADHRTLVETNLDTEVTTRAAQTSVDTVQSGVDDVQDDVDLLDTSVADLDVDVAAVDDQVEVIDGKLDDAQSEADDQAEFLTAFQDLALQLRIEADLIRDGDERISLFQLPDGAGTVGGYLEIVHAIVEEAIVQRAAAGRNLGHGPEYFALASRLYSEEAYKKAYTEYRNAYRELLAVQ